MLWGFIWAIRRFLKLGGLSEFWLGTGFAGLEHLPLRWEAALPSAPTVASEAAWMPGGDPSGARPGLRSQHTAWL